MSKLSMQIPHSLPKEEALTRIKGLLKSLKTDHADMISDVKEDWKDDNAAFSFSAKGFDLAGNIQVNPSNIAIDADLPFLVSMFSGKIKSIISEKAEKLLAKK